MKMRRMFCALEDRLYVSAFVVGYSQNQCWSSMSFLWPQTSSSQNFTSDSFVSLTNISQPLAKRGFNPFCLNAAILSQQCLSYRTCSMWRFEILSQVQAFWTSMIQQNSSHLSCLFVHFSAAKRVTILFGGCVTANLGVVTDWWLPVLRVLPKLPGNLVNSKATVSSWLDGHGDVVHWWQMISSKGVSLFSGKYVPRQDEKFPLSNIHTWMAFPTAMKGLWVPSCWTNCI